MSRDAVAARGTGEAQRRRAIPRAKARAAAGGLSDEGAGSGLKRAAACGAGTVLLFLGYLRVSWTVAATSDGAALALQARDMLAGNWLLHGWTLSDVSFYTTELPEYVLVEAVRPFGLGVIHVAAAATYTLLVLVVIALARGRAGGREGIAPGCGGGRDYAGAAARVRGVRAAAVAGSCRHAGAAAGRLAAARLGAAPLVGADGPVPAAGRGSVRGPGGGADGGAAADRRRAA